jgi:regulation of enolase protein 1 (concanavalin A-like superfamily)
MSGPTAHIINRTLAKRPVRHYQTYDELTQNLEYALEQLQQQIKGGGTPAARQRVVLETAEDQEKITWLVVAMIGAVAIFIACFLFLGKKNRPVADISANSAGEAANNAGKFAMRSAASTRIPAILKEGVLALSKADTKAAETLRAASTDGTLSPTDRAWAQALEGWALLASNEPLVARKTFAQVPALASRMNDEAVAAFLKDISTRISQPEIVPVSDANRLNTATHEAVGLLFYGLHNWQLGHNKEAVEILRSFRNAKPTQTTPWIDELKPLATAFVERWTNYEMLPKQLEALRTAGERTDAIDRFRKMDPVLATKLEPVFARCAKEIADFRSGVSTPNISAPAAVGVNIFRIINEAVDRVIEVADYTQEDGAELEIGLSLGKPNQHWYYIPVEGDMFRLAATHSGKMLDLADGRVDDGAKIQQLRDHNGDTQKWRIEKLSDVSCRIQSVVSGKVLCLKNPNDKENSAVTQRTSTGADDEIWRLEWPGWKAGDFAEGFVNRGVDGRITKQGENCIIRAANKDGGEYSDSFCFGYQVIKGDFEIVASLNSVDQTNERSQAGIMARTTLWSNSANIALFASGQGSLTHRCRISASRESSVYPSLTNLPTPRWIRLTRRGNVFTSSHSADGKNWTIITWDTLGDLGEYLLVGMFAASNDEKTKVTATFSNVSITQPK